MQTHIRNTFEKLIGIKDVNNLLRQFGSAPNLSRQRCFII